MELALEAHRFCDFVRSLPVLETQGQQQLIASGSVRSLEPFEKTIVRLVCSKSLKKGSKQNLTVVLEHAGYPTETFSKAVILPSN